MENVGMKAADATMKLRPAMEAMNHLEDAITVLSEEITFAEDRLHVVLTPVTPASVYEDHNDYSEPTETAKPAVSGFTQDLITSTERLNGVVARVQNLLRRLEI